MAQNKRYFWLKLHEEFFDDESVKFIQSLPDGDKVVIIYLKLLLKSLKNNGLICLQGFYATPEEDLALMLREDVKMIRYAMSALKKAQLLETGSDEEQWSFYMNRIPEMTGVCSETASSRRSRISRAKKAAQIETKQQGSVALQQKSSKVQQICSTEIEKEIETEKKIEKETESDAESDAELDQKQKSSSPHGPYGVNENVILSDAEYDSLKKLYPDYLVKIDYFSSYMATTGKKYDNHYHTILQWAKKDELKRPQAANKKKPFEDYSFEEGESF